MAQCNHSKMMARNWCFKCQNSGGFETEVNIRRLQSFNIICSPRSCWKRIWGHVFHYSAIPHCIDSELPLVISRSTRREIFSILYLKKKKGQKLPLLTAYSVHLLCWPHIRVAKQLKFLSSARTNDLSTLTLQDRLLNQNKPKKLKVYVS